MNKNENAYRSIGEVAKLLNLVNKKNGKLNNSVPKELVGLDRFEARELIVKKLKELSAHTIMDNITKNEKEIVGILKKIKQLVDREIPK